MSWRADAKDEVPSWRAGAGNSVLSWRERTSTLAADEGTILPTPDDPPGSRLEQLLRKAASTATVSPNYRPGPGLPVQAYERETVAPARQTERISAPAVGIYRASVLAALDRLDVEQWTTPACSYCKEKDRTCLVRCGEPSCGRFFCNSGGAGKSRGGPSSHILFHMRLLNHNAIHVELTTAEGTSMTPVTCSQCPESNVYSLSYDKRLPRRDRAHWFCRDHWTAQNLPEPYRMPMVNCHPPFARLADKLVADGISTNRPKKNAMTYDAMYAMERQLCVDSTLQTLKPGVDYQVGIRYSFDTVLDYKNHFKQLCRLASKLEEMEVLQISALEEVDIIQHAARKGMVHWLTFDTTSEVHTVAFNIGAMVTLQLSKRTAGVSEYRGRIDSRIIARNGMVTFKVMFKKDEGMLAERMLSGDQWDIKLAFDDVNGKRYQEALKDFGGRRCARDVRDGIIGGATESDDDSSDEGSSGYTDSSSRRSSPSVRYSSPVTWSDSGESTDLDEQFAKLDLGYKFTSSSGDINDSQEKAVQMALREAVSLIQGPPGTGKTHTMVEIVKRYLITNPKSKVLLCAASNDAADHMARKCAELNMFKVVRVQSRANAGRATEDAVIQKIAMNTLMQAVAAEHGYRGRVEDMYEIDRIRFSKLVVDTSQIVCATCSTASVQCLTGYKFRLVIVDEATQATEPEVLIAVNHGCERLVLIGDQKQLGVTVKSEELEKTSWGQSMFERLIAGCKVPSVMLDTQYRMHPAIAKPCSQVIYDSLLKDGAGMAEKRRCNALNFFKSLHDRYSNIIFIDTQTQQHELAANGTSILNVKEADCVALLLAKLLHSGVSAENIGVITFYNGQKDELKRSVKQHACLKNWAPSLMIDSVDAFQGREKDYIVLSSVRSGKGSIGFLADPRRLNVALTRAKKGVVIVGNRRNLDSDKNGNWKKVLAFYQTIPEAQAFVYMGYNNRNANGCPFCKR